MEIKTDPKVQEEQTTSATSNVEANESQTPSTETPVEEVTAEQVDPISVNNVNNADNSYPLKRLSEKFVYEVMEVPSASHHEYRMVLFIMLWAKRNGITYEMDDYGNIYLTKGELDGTECYPCVTAHLDTVQQKQILYAKSGAKLNIITSETTDKKHKINVEGFGIGGDDKAGVVLCLSMFSYFDKLKACFFLEEETGCDGSRHLDTEWFKNVGYVIGYDSPDLNRAAYSCSGTKLMNKQFFEDNGLAEICAKHGLNDFRSEPFTDVVQIRQKTDVICMNFGTGYYNCHMDNEYCIIEDMDEALDLGVDIINKLGLDEYRMKHMGGTGTVYSYSPNDTDSKYFEGLNPKKATSTVTRYNGYCGRDYDDYYDDEYYGEYGGWGGHSHTGGSSSGSTTPSTSSSTTSKENQVNYEQIEHVTKTYEEYILTIKEEIQAACKKNDVDFKLFEEAFSKKIVF